MNFPAVCCYRLSRENSARKLNRFWHHVRKWQKIGLAMCLLQIVKNYVNFIVSELFKRKFHENRRMDLYYLRTSNGDEIDLIIDHGLTFEMVEIKASMTWRPDQMKTLKKYAGQSSNARLVYQGETYSEVDGIQVINYKDFLTA